MAFGVLMVRQFVPQPHDQDTKQRVGVIDALELGQFASPQASDNRHGLYGGIRTRDVAQEPCPYLMVRNQAGIPVEQIADCTLAWRFNLRLAHGTLFGC